MTGGISAIKGFEYQATVILDRIFDHFDAHGASARIRPEGDDDLDLSWSDAEGLHRSYAQIKKPREDVFGRRTPKPWSLAEVASELMADAVRRLLGNDHRQLWVLGDEVAADVQALVAAGGNAPTLEPQAYWGLLQAMARAKSLSGESIPAKRSLGKWSMPTVSADPVVALAELAAAFEGALKAKGLDALAAPHAAELARLHASLPLVLDRITIEATYGLEEVVRQRVQDRLEVDYRLARRVVEKTLFRNLVGFIQDIVKQSGRDFDRVEFELELRAVWPLMSPVRDPIKLPADHVPRSDIVRGLAEGPGVLEVVGISGAGKSTLMAEAARSLGKAAGRHVVTVDAGPNDTLRDVLAGAAFHLRRFGHDRPFAEIVDRSRASDEVLEDVIAAMEASTDDIWLLIDFVEGRAGDRFSAELTGLVRRRVLGTTRLLLFAQQRVVSTLSGADQSMLGVGSIDVRGFDFEEFVRLAEHHGHSDRARLHRIHERLSAGRSAGLSPQLASALAHLQSYAEMELVAKQPADQHLAQAELLRFQRLSPRASKAGERLACFTLPFTRPDAEAAFPGDNVGAAITELLQLGLLRQRGELFEMHEQVRAGLEMMLARQTRLETHGALALWAGQRGLVGAKVYHLRRAGMESEAEAAARSAFLSGEAWDVLAAFVAEKRLVTAAEAIEAAFAGDEVSSWQLAGVLHGLGDTAAVENLMDRAVQGGLTLLADYHRGRALIGAIMALDPGKLPALMALVLDADGPPGKRDDALLQLLLANRHDQRLSPQAMSFIEARPLADQHDLIGFLWRDGRRAALSLAFGLEAGRSEPRADRRHRLEPWLRLEDARDVSELLAALPSAKIGLMLARRSVMLERHADLLWRYRRELTAHAPALCADPGAEDAVRVQALRVLIFLGQSDLERLVGDFVGVGGLFRSMVMVAPALAPGMFAAEPLEARVDDVALDWPSRLLAASALVALGGRALDLRRRLMPGCPFPENQRDLMLQSVGPLDVADAEALAMLERLTESQPPPPAGLLASSVLQLADAEGAEITPFLAGLCRSGIDEIANASIVALGERRDRSALPALVAALASETKPARAAALAAAVAACGAMKVAELDSPVSGERLTAWRCIVAGRANDVAAADDLIAIALDGSESWQVRRAAIRAAGRLPFSAALDRIAPSILGAPLPLIFDDFRLRGHQALIDLIRLGVLDVIRAPAPSPVFSDDLRDILTARWGDDLPSALAFKLIRWLGRRLQSEHWPYTPVVALRIYDELHLPMLHAATLRALARCGEAAPIERNLKGATNFWQAQKCLIALAKMPPFGDSLKRRVTALLDESAFAGNERLVRLIDELSPGPRSWPDRQAMPKDAPKSIDVSAPAVAAALAGDTLQAGAGTVLIVTGIDEPACERLIPAASPALDPDMGTVTYKRDLKLTGEGQGLVSVSKQYSSKTDGGDLRDRLRAAIAAANVWGLAMPWHDAKLSDRYPDSYVRLYLDALAARGDATLFYDALARYEPFLMPALCARGGARAIGAMFDNRLLPALLRHVHAGDRSMFAGLCALAAHVSGPEADPLVQALFNRWLDYFPPAANGGLDEESVDVWIGFRDLSAHPRFGRIPRWRAGLERVMAAELSPYRAETLVRIAARDRRAYVAIEKQFLKFTEWEDYVFDRVDELDAICDDLWHQIEPA